MTFRLYFIGQVLSALTITNCYKKNVIASTHSEYFLHSKLSYYSMFLFLTHLQIFKFEINKNSNLAML